MPKVMFLKDGKAIKEVEVENGANLRRAALDNEVAVHHEISDFATALVQYVNCFGNGLCGTCHIHVKKGMENCSPKTTIEKIRLSYALFAIGHEDEVRLSCQTRVLGDVEVEVQPKMNTSGERFWETKSPSFTGAKE